MPLPDRYQRDIESESSEPREPEISRRSRGLALALGILGGFFGLHRFYVGKSKTGLGMIVTVGGFGIWWLYDMVLLAAGEFRDADDLPLRNWGVEQPRRLPGRAERRIEDLEDRLDGLQTQFDDLAERVDFAERMLAQQRDTPRLKP